MPTSTSYSLTNLPPWHEAILKNIAESSRDVASRAYVPYQGPRIARVNPELQEAHRRGILAGIQRPYLQTSDEYIRGSQIPFHQDYKRYMSPYMNEVVNKIGEQGQRTFSERIMPQLESAFVGLGHYGSSQHQDLARRAGRDISGEIANAQARALQQGYQQAAQIHGVEQDRRLTGADALSVLGQRAHAAHLTDVDSIRDVGREKREMEQENLNLAHQDFLRSQQHPRLAISEHAATVSGLPNSQHTYGALSYQAPYQQVAPPEMNRWGRLGGLASVFAGANMRRKKGGLIKKPKKKMGNQSIAQSSFVRQPKVGGKFSLKRNI